MRCERRCAVYGSLATLRRRFVRLLERVDSRFVVLGPELVGELAVLLSLEALGGGLLPRREVRASRLELLPLGRDLITAAAGFILRIF